MLNVMLFMYKFKKGILPSSFDTMFVLNTEIHGHFTRQYNCYHSPVWRLEVRRRTISVQGPYFWNLIRKRIDCNCSISTFKLRMKAFLINNDVPYQVWKACGQYIYYLESYSCALTASISVCINVLFFLFSFFITFQNSFKINCSTCTFHCKKNDYCLLWPDQFLISVFFMSGHIIFGFYPLCHKCV